MPSSWHRLNGLVQVAGEAAGIGMGLLMSGSGSDKAAEMLAYAHDTTHEKIIRGELIYMRVLRRESRVVDVILIFPGFQRHPHWPGIALVVQGSPLAWP